MTTEKFDTIHWGASTKVIHRDTVYTVRSVDFEEKLIGVDDTSVNNADENAIVWKRCENVELVTQLSMLL